MTKKMKILSKQVILKFWSAKVSSVPPNSAPSLRLWLHVTTTSFICVISVPACLIHSSTTASSAWYMGFLGQRVSRFTWSSTRFRAGTHLYIVYTSQFGLLWLPVPCWVNC